MARHPRNMGGSQFRLGQINKLVGLSVVAHWLLETQGHYFEVTKPGFMEREFSGAVPINDVPWDAEERIYKTFEIGHTSLSWEEIEVKGYELLSARHYNVAVINCQTEIQHFANEIVDDPNKDFSWPWGTRQVLNGMAMLKVAALGVLAYAAQPPAHEWDSALPFSAFDNALGRAMADQVEKCEPVVGQIAATANMHKNDILKLKDLVMARKIDEKTIGDCLEILQRLPLKELGSDLGSVLIALAGRFMSFFKDNWRGMAELVLEKAMKPLMVMGGVVLLSYFMYKVFSGCIQFYRDVANEGWPSALWNVTAPGYLVPIWAGVMFGPPGVAWVSGFYTVRFVGRKSYEFLNEPGTARDNVATRRAALSQRARWNSPVVRAH